MSIEAGARAGLITPDQTTFDYIKGRRYAPRDVEFENMVDFWQENLKANRNAQFDRSVSVNIGGIAPQVTWGTNPMTIDVTESIPYPEEFAKRQRERSKSLA